MCPAEQRGEYPLSIGLATDLTGSEDRVALGTHPRVDELVDGDGVDLARIDLRITERTSYHITLCSIAISLQSVGRWLARPAFVAR